MKNEMNEKETDWTKRPRIRTYTCSFLNRPTDIAAYLTFSYTMKTRLDRMIMHHPEQEATSNSRG